MVSIEDLERDNEKLRLSLAENGGVRVLRTDPPTAFQVVGLKIVVPSLALLGLVTV